MPDIKWDLTRISSSEFGALRRCAGVPFGSDMRAAQAFYHASAGVKPYQVSAWYAAMCLQCLWKPDDVKQTLPFEEILRSIYQDPDATESTRKRCTVFLDTPWNDDGFLLGKLCALARIMRSSNGSIMPDFEALADDLNSWNSLDRYIQRRWIRTICANRTQEDNPQTVKEENNDAV